MWWDHLISDVHLGFFAVGECDQSNVDFYVPKWVDTVVNSWFCILWGWIHKLQWVLTSEITGMVLFEHESFTGRNFMFHTFGNKSDTILFFVSFVYDINWD